MKTLFHPLSILSAAGFLLLANPVHAQYVTSTVPVTGNPSLVALNPATNRIYVAGQTTTGSMKGAVSVIDGASGSVIATVTVGANPMAIGVNPETNQIYVACKADGTPGSPGSVSVIDGATNSASAVAVGIGPVAIAVNPATNRIYVANYGDATGASVTKSSVSVIDGASATVVASVTAVGIPDAIAVNPVTNRTYVANRGVVGGVNTGCVTVIDGTNNSASVMTVSGPANTILDAIAVNPVTNQVFVTGAPAGSIGGHLYVIDGASATVTASVVLALGPYHLAVNPLTNKVYVIGSGEYTPVQVVNFGQAWTVRVVDGATGTIDATLYTGSDIQNTRTGVVPEAITVNPSTNKIYAANWAGGSVLVINGANNSFASMSAPGEGSATAITANPLTNQIYVANYGGDVTVVDGNVFPTATVAVGTYPAAMALNPVTNTLYVANRGDGVTNGTVSVLNGLTNAVTSTVTVGAGPWALAANPVTNKIYVVNMGNGYSNSSVSVIDSTTNTVIATVPVGIEPMSATVNPVTNKIYVINSGRPGYVGGSVSVIDGITDTVVATLNVRPNAIAINTRTNRVYFSNNNNVTVLDGSNSAIVATIPTTSNGAIAVNPVTNRIYAINQNGFNVNVIEGATNTVIATPGTQLDPTGIAINTVTNTVYVANMGSGNFPGYLTVINGATNASSWVPVANNSQSLAVDEVTNTIYVSGFNYANGSFTSPAVTVVNGASKATVTLTVGSPLLAGQSISANAILANPVTSKIYAANQYSGAGTVTIIGDHQTIPLTTSFTPLSSDNRTSSPAPTLTFGASSSFSPIAPPPRNVFYQLDSLVGPWTKTANAGAVFTCTPPALAPGLHVLYAYADDGQDAGSTQLNSPLTGEIDVYEFVVTSAATHFAVNAPASAYAGTPVTVTVSALDALNNPANDYAGSVTLTSSDGAAVFSPASGDVISLSGTFSATLYSNLAPQTITATDTVNPAHCAK